VHLADALLWGVILLSAIVPWVEVAGVRASRTVRAISCEQLAGPVEGDAAAISVLLRARGMLPKFMLAARYRVSGAGGGEHRFYLPVLPSKTGGQATGEFVFEKRGRAELGRLTVECGAPFGLFRRRRTLGQPQGLLVYPRWVEVRQLGLLDSSRGEAGGLVRARAGAEVAGSRRYVAGDARRYLHWKNTARTGRLMVKEFDSWSDRVFVIAFGAHWGRAEGAETPFEYAVRLAASVSKPMFASGGQVLIAASGGLSRTFVSWPDLMAELAVIEPDSGVMPPVAVPPGARVFGLVHANDLGSASALIGTARQGNQVAAAVVEGLSSGGSAAGLVSMLQSSGIAAVACLPGALEAAVRAIEQGGDRHARQAQPHAADPVTGRTAAAA
jgi:uncharacterized protein (DUF58 family)